uniref:CARB-SepT-1 n=1 Tax=Sepioteuthis australis TaxID=61682 RepID=R4FI40_9MOLL
MQPFIWLLLIGVAQVGAKTYSNYHLFRVTPKNQQQLTGLKDMFEDEDSEVDFWIAPSSMNRTTEFLVPPHFVSSVKDLLDSLEAETLVLHEDIQTIIDEESTSPSKNDSQFTSYSTGSITDKYASYEEIVNWMKVLAKTYDHAKLIEFGYTFERRKLYAIKFSTGPNKKGIFVESGMHSREWISIASSVKIIERMATQYKSDKEIDELLALYDWTFVPYSNPDGYYYTQHFDRMWRKNRRPINLFCTGTDINRNFASGWGGPGASRNPCNPTFRGTSVFSEPESRALAQLVKQSAPLVGFFSVHAYSQLILTPYGYTYEKPSDSPELTQLAIKAATAMKKVDGKQFTVGTPPDILYIATGGAYDWAKLKMNIKYAYAFELRPSQNGRNGFIIPKRNIKPSSLELFAALKTFAKGFR